MTQTFEALSEQALQDYRLAGTERALKLDNRGPIQFDETGRLDQTFMASYLAHGFYVFENVLDSHELADIEADMADLQNRAPSGPKSLTDIHGRPALGAELKGKNFGWVAPLSDPVGGTERNDGRHPVKMHEPVVPTDAPKHVLQIVLGSLQFSDACLRLYGHPGLLAVAEAVNGPDFAPFNEAIWIKQPRFGGSVAWHQDGTTQWDRPDFDSGTHGFNFMAQLYGCDADNGLWILPGSHGGKADIKALVADSGSDRLNDAVPLICKPGDVAICNRQAVHGSFANTSVKPRVTINFGFHRRQSVLGAKGNGIHSASEVYDEARIFKRSKVIGYAISARVKRRPEEEPYAYQPLRAHKFEWNEAARANLQDYNLLDLGI